MKLNPFFLVIKLIMEKGGTGPVKNSYSYATLCFRVSICAALYHTERMPWYASATQ
jgi:hypothetical protein